MPNEDNVHYQEKKGIGRIVLDRPEALNGLSEDILQRFASILDKVKTDDGVKAVMITGAGEKAFSRSRYQFPQSGHAARSPRIRQAGCCRQPQDRNPREGRCCCY